MVNKDWIRINKAISDRYGEVNTEYAPLFEKQKTKNKKQTEKTV